MTSPKKIPPDIPIIDYQQIKKKKEKEKKIQNKFSSIYQEF